MAEVKNSNPLAPLDGLSRLPALRQIAIIVGLAASIAVGVAVVLWSQEPGYRMLYSGLADQDMLAVTGALDQAGIPYRIKDGAGTVLVPGDKVHEARLKLAGAGLPKGTGGGFEMLDKDQGFGVSQFMENARYQRALEGELARTIGTMSGVQGARVHLAIPKQSSFIRDRDRRQPSGSVMVNLYQGRSLDEGQVSAIVHMVASSVPNLHPDHVTVVDQSGKLLTAPEGADNMQLTATQFDYRRRLEEYYIKRIEEILAPIAGAGGVRAQVSAEINFSDSEQTQETYNPDLPAVRSEQTAEEQSKNARGASGVPGALTNQPPAAGTVGGKPAAPGAESDAGVNNSSRRVTRNYELDKTISHTRLPGGAVNRLSVAVLVDDKQSVNEKGEVTRTPFTEEEIARFTSLVKEAVGFNVQRGDSVNIINASFTVPPAAPPAPEPSFLERPWVMDAVKQVLAGIAVLALIFLVLRPVMRSLAEKAAVAAAAPSMTQEGGGAALPPGASPPQAALAAQQAAMQLAPPANYEQQLAMAKTMVSQDPKRVAQVVKNWVSTDGG